MGATILFVTGTDTGVGKTLLTAMLLCHLRARGKRALAVKPFCSGGRADAELLHKLQDGDLTLDDINPFYFPEPVSPLVSARKRRARVSLKQVVRHIRSIAERAGQIPLPQAGSAEIKNAKSKIKNYLLIEGSGGLLVPLGEGYTVSDLIARLACDVLVVARNRLGTINHTLLTVQSLSESTPQSALKVVLMDSPPSDDVSRRSNPAILAEWIRPIPLVKLPFLGDHCRSVSKLKKLAHQVQNTLASIF